MIGRAICHIGLGNFSRAHLAAFNNAFLNKVGPCEWGICAIERDFPRSQELEAYLRANDFKYKLITKAPNGTEEEEEIIAFTDFINMGQNPEAALARLAHEGTRIVSLTITEKGYYCDVNTGDLLVAAPEIEHDLSNLAQPKSALGLITGGLKQRFETSTDPFTVMSLDNLPGNGHICKRAVTQFADKVDDKLAAWIHDNVMFPSTMVDRITPQTKAASDPIVSEKYIQWVVEDSFSNGRPYWDILDHVLLVPDVMPYEKMKVRLLNGTHSALSYISYLDGHRIVDKALADQDVNFFTRMFLAEQVKTVPPVPGVELTEYCDVLLERFANPSIKDQVQRLAEDGSTKTSTTWAPVILDHIADKRDTPLMALAVASWIRYMAGVDDLGNPITITDPRADELKPLAIKALQKRDVLPFIKATLGEDIAASSRFVKSVGVWYKRLLSEGAGRVLGSLDQFGMTIDDGNDTLNALVDDMDLGLMTTKEISEVFHAYDTNKDGHLDQDELGHLITDIMQRLKEKLPNTIRTKMHEDEVSEEQISAAIMEATSLLDDVKFSTGLLQRLDVNHDGEVTLDEFQRGFTEITRLYFIVRDNAMIEHAEEYEDDVLWVPSH